MKKSLGLVEVLTGHGAGKTTAALGHALRSIGHGMKVAMIQWLKKDSSIGEIKAIKKYLPRFDVWQFGRKKFIRKPAKIDFELAQKGLTKAKEVIQSGKYDLVILDEVNIALWFGLLNLKDVIRVIKNRPRHVELILTGRYAPKRIIDLADSVSEIEEVKHYFKKGIKARKGVEY